MRRGYRVEGYNVQPVADTPYGFAFESDNNHTNQYYRDGEHVRSEHHTYYIPVIAKTTNTRSSIGGFPHHQHTNNLQRREHWPETTDNHRVISSSQSQYLQPNVTREHRRDIHWPEITTDRVISIDHDDSQYQHGNEHAKKSTGGDYLDYISRLEKIPSLYGSAAPPPVQKPDKQVTYQEYVTSDEEYDSDAQEMVKMKITTRVEKRAVKW